MQTIISIPGKSEESVCPYRFFTLSKINGHNPK